MQSIIVSFPFPKNLPPQALEPSLSQGSLASRAERAHLGLTADYRAAGVDVLLLLVRFRTHNEAGEPLLTRSEPLGRLGHAYHRAGFRSSTHTRLEHIGTQSDLPAPK